MTMSNMIMNKIMKKTIFILFLLISIMLSLYILQFNSVQKQKDSLMVLNIEALADPEIIVGPFCMVTSHICTVESDSFFLRGIPQPW